MPFTKEQEQAIKEEGKDILVSASAGSGKTTVLTQRVLKEIMSGRNVDELLIVTFTKAAAEEMKKRIKSELITHLKDDLSSKQRNHLRTQLNNIDTANISTIDAFCLEVIHRFYYAINLDPSFSVLTDDTQAALLKEQALHEVESQKLENNDTDFLAFYDNFAGDRDAESARDLLLDLYNFAMAKPKYRTWLKSLANEYKIEDKLVLSDLWQQKIKPYLLDIATNIQAELKTITTTSQFETTELEKLRVQFLKFEQNLSNFIEVVNNDASYNTQRDMIRHCLFDGTLRISKKWDEDIQDVYNEAKEVRSNIQSQIYDIFTSFFVTDEKEQLEVIRTSQKIVSAIIDSELALIDRFSELKRDQNLLDYGDIEQMAYTILSQDTSNSQLARDFYQNKFKEILVDEYQDINPLQENIIQLLKQEGKNNLFMVGDVKQSIYGFRQAEPSLFLKKYHEFGKDNNKYERILLSDNFRSTEPVTKVVNTFFNQILTPNFGGIDYQKEGQLIFGAKYYPKHLNKATEVIYHKKSKDDKDFSEIQMVIDRIKQFEKENLQIYDAKLGHTRKFTYSDIAILTRSRSHNLEIMQEFGKANISLFVTDAENYFQTFELTVIMNYLKIIDNPDQDIPLVTVLRSPLFNFSETEFAKIRIKSKNNSFYNALTSYVSKNDELSKKIKNFLNQLEELRDFSATHRISDLIWSIYAKTNLLEIMTALPNGEQRRVNLEALYERATSYESAGFKGLYQFINFIERIRRSQKDLSQPLLTKEAGNSIKLMTIHGSKGLEFPIVFYLGIEKKYQMSDLRGNYVINPNELGITLRKSQYRIDSLIKSYGNIEKKRQLLEEEARIFYVALTRAKQKLILIGDIASFDKKLSNWQKQNPKALLHKLNANSPLDFIGPSLKLDRQISQNMADISSAIDENKEVLFIDYSAQELSENTSQEEATENSQDSALLIETARKLYDFDYPFKDASQTTAYQAVSEIKKAFNDPLETDLENSRLISSTNRYLQPIDTKPNFLFETSFTGAEIGTATHLILQYYDYKNNDEKQLEKELEELVLRKKLNPEIISSIKKDQIEWFVHSDFAKKFWKKPENLKREVDFSSLISASKLFGDFSDKNAKILVHGTIDGYFIDEDGIILFDYKTDYVDKNHLNEAITNIKQKYTGQLRLYEQALNGFSDKKVKGKYLILLDAKQVIEVK
ncbi:helicase-exonuclease AddAB subunit AddA [Lactobacillus sp. LL6]|uniref:helicase-exonuclease AddAB subunit AddA n=1 Tax=Lactobacillus sp. LL6 TaxID=2596827 RepID=UPI0011851190|nr:helicase-exonuclease AddAB subunit AddA [Lactobacillus sp. LL6]TSO26343.1 helicase-exonuclease AddAB subunit AddA [Lactobacillus sp. LL6]